MQAVARENFLPPYAKHLAEFDVPVAIGYGQTNSQPYTVRLMLTWLDPQPGDKVLDVGSGSGWTTALLAWLVGSKGEVHAVERIPELVRMGAANCRRAGIQGVFFHEAGEVLGWPATAPYDRILVSATSDELPAELLSQLRDGGRTVIPVRDEILVLGKKHGQATTERHTGFAFVPLLP